MHHMLRLSILSGCLLAAGLNTLCPSNARCAPPELTKEEQQAGFRPVFNGFDLTGWEGAGKPADSCWNVEDGLLMCNGKPGPWLRSRRTYGDFNFRFDYRLEPAGNSGVYVRVPANGHHHRHLPEEPEAGFEIQLLDDEHQKYAELKDYQYTGSIYAITPATRRVGKPAGEWNSMEIDCFGRQVTVIHNGQIIVAADAADFPSLALRNEKGYLGLQNHSSHVWFRNLRIGPGKGPAVAGVSGSTTPASNPRATAGSPSKD